MNVDHVIDVEFGFAGAEHLVGEFVAVERVELDVEEVDLVVAGCNTAVRVDEIEGVRHTDAEGGQLAVVSLVGSDDEPDVRESLFDGVDGGSLVVLGGSRGWGEDGIAGATVVLRAAQATSASWIKAPSKGNSNCSSKASMTAQQGAMATVAIRSVRWVSPVSSWAACAGGVATIRASTSPQASPRPPNIW